MRSWRIFDGFSCACACMVRVRVVVRVRVRVRVCVCTCVCVCLCCFSSYSLFCEFFCRGIFIQISKLYLIHCGCICLSFNQKACWSLRWIDVLITQALESPRFSHISVTLRFSHRAKLRGTMPPGIMSSPGPPRRQSKHRQLVIQSTQAQATSYTSISSTRSNRWTRALPWGPGSPMGHRPGMCA